MDSNEFLRKLDSVPTVAPDELDLSMIAEAERENDGTSVSLEEFRERMEYSGKLNIRIPKSLHSHLVESAKEDGVSLNQYILYKLAQ